MRQNVYPSDQTLVTKRGSLPEWRIIGPIREWSIPTEPIHPDILALIQRALEEDVGSGDITSSSIISKDARAKGRIFAKEAGVIAGLEVAKAVYAHLDPDVLFQAEMIEGSLVKAGGNLAIVSGFARSLLTAERTALNFLGRMSGIASLTRRFVDAVAGTQAVILDTRKTAPGLRQLEKLAVRLGGGRNHRTGLYDMLLIKDNHIDFAGSLAEAVHLARAAHEDVELEVEARTLEDVRIALELEVRRIMLDNMPVDEMTRAVGLSSGRAQLEASGNVSLENVRRIAETGVDFISVGALTHSARVLDISFELIRG